MDEPFQIYIIGYDILNLSPTRENYSAKFGIFRETFQRPAMFFWNQRAHRLLRRIIRCTTTPKNGPKLTVFDPPCGSGQG